MTAATPAPIAPDTYPGKTLGIVSIVLAFVFTLLGLILGIVAFNQSKAVGIKNTPAKVAIILSIIFIAVGIVVGIIAGITSAALVGTQTY